MPYLILADPVVLLHVLFVLFVVFGGLTVLRRRRLGGESGYRATFIERYPEPRLYPPCLTLDTQLFPGLAALLVNLSIYALFRSKRRS